MLRRALTVTVKLVLLRTIDSICHYLPQRSGIQAAHRPVDLRLFYVHSSSLEYAAWRLEAGRTDWTDIISMYAFPFSLYRANAASYRTLSLSDRVPVAISHAGD